MTSFDKSFLNSDNELNYPKTSLIKKNSLVFIFSDFLYNVEVLEKFIYKLKRKNISGYIIQVLDPMEINFQIKESSILKDMENNASLTVDDSISCKASYQKNFRRLKENLNYLCKNNNWNYLLYNTSNLLEPFLLKIIKKITLKKD